MMNHNKSQQSSKNVSTQQTLLKIRNLIIQNKNNENKQFQIYQRNSQNKNISIDPQILLRQASRIIEQSKRQQANKQTISKLKQANQIVKNQQDHIKNYIKQKITSNLFHTPKKLSQEQQLTLQKQKQQLLKRRKKQIQEQQKRKSQAIQNTRKFRKGQKVSNVPISYINSLMRNTTYYQSQQYQAQVFSQNNQITNPTDQIKTKINTNYVNSSIINANQKIKDQRQFQFDTEQENQKGFLDKYEQQYTQNLRKTLQKHPKVVAVLKQFLQKQIRLTSKSFVDLISALWSVSRSSASLIQSQPQTQIYQYKVRPSLNSNLIKQKSLTNLVKKYKNTKPVRISSQKSEQKNLISEMLISKRVGQSYKFHTKKSILFSNQILYADEKSQELKKMSLPIQNIKAIQMKKEEGSFINKKQTLVDVVHIKGNQRNLYFIQNELQGKELYNQLIKLMTLKVYNNCALVNGRQNRNLQNFIKDQKCINLDLSNFFISALQRNNFRQLYDLSVPILSTLLSERTMIEIINLSQCKLESNALLSLLSVFHHKNKYIRKINLNQNLLSKESLQMAYLICKSSEQDNIHLALSKCQINDQVFITNSLSLKQVISKLSHFDLSFNKISGKSIQVLSSCICSKPKSVLKQLNISKCNLKNNAFCLDNLLNSALKLQVLICRCCGLALDDEQLKILLKHRNKNRLLKLDLSQNQPLYDLQGIQSNWNDHRPVQLFIDVGRFTDKVSTMLKGQIRKNI